MIRAGTWRISAPMLLLVAVLGLAGCGEQGSAENTATDPAPADAGNAAPPGSPDCAEIWRDGVRIPRTYRGCVDGSGGYVERDALGCSSGQRMVRFADRFYGVLGGTVHEAAESLDRDREYRDAVHSCRG